MCDHMYCLVHLDKMYEKIQFLSQLWVFVGNLTGSVFQTELRNNLPKVYSWLYVNLNVFPFSVVSTPTRIL